MSEQRELMLRGDEDKIEKKSKSRVSIVPLMWFAERLLNDILSLSLSLFSWSKIIIIML